MSDSKTSQTTALVSAEASPLPRPVTMWLGMMVVAPLASVVCAYGHWFVFELSFEPNRVVWRFYSLRRNEVYDCVERKVKYY